MIPRAFVEFFRDKKRDELITAIVRAGFEFTGDPQHVVRRLAVVERVAKYLRTPVSTSLVKEVTRVCCSLGATKIAVGNRRLFRGVKPRGMTEGEALALARLCRNDPRNKR